MKQTVFVLLGILQIVCLSALKAQPSATPTELLQISGNEIFRNADYAAALAAFLELERRNVSDPMLKYKIGFCYFNSPNHKVKAVGYFEYAVKAKNEAVPPEVFYYLGRLYHLENRFIDALNAYNQYLEAYGNQEPLITDVPKQMLYCQNAVEFSAKADKETTAKPDDMPINTFYQERAPVVAPDGSFIMFSSGRRKDSFYLLHEDVFLSPDKQSVEEDVYLAYRRGLGWTQPYYQDLSAPYVTPLSVSTDGSTLLLAMGPNQETADFYTTNIKNSRWGKPRKLSKEINSKFGEWGASFSANSEVVYFSSNRPGGYGGYDIYKAYRKSATEWSEPINLGPEINTSDDEITPYAHPDNKTLFFSSNGRNSIGGFDVFSSVQTGARWSEPVSLGIPINSSADDLFYVESGNRKHAYLSSDRIHSSSLGMSDIISIFRLDKTVPRAMVFGRIIVKSKGKSLPVTLKVSPEGSDIVEKYVYNPDKVTGDFFMILLQKQNYTVTVTVNDSPMHQFHIDIPAETYKYNLNYELELTDVLVLGRVVGQKIVPREAKSEVTKLSQALVDIPSERNIKYDVLDELIEKIIDRSDVEGLASLNDLDKPAREPASRPDKPQQQEDNYYTPLIKLVEQAIESNNPYLLEQVTSAPRSAQITETTVYIGEKVSGNKLFLFAYQLGFQSDSARITPSEIESLKEITGLLRNDMAVSLEVAWQQDVPKETIALQLRLLEDFLKEQYIQPQRYRLVGDDSQLMFKDRNYIEIRVLASVRD